VDLFEYQARDVFEAHQVPVLRGLVATAPEEARVAAEQLCGGTVVVKAQVKTGGRGKAGGAKLAHSPAEAEERAREILGMDIKGHTVRRVMIAEELNADWAGFGYALALKGEVDTGEGEFREFLYVTSRDDAGSRLIGVSCEAAGGAVEDFLGYELLRTVRVDED